MSGLELLGAASAIIGLVGVGYAISSRVCGVYTNSELALFREEIRQFTTIWPAIERILAEQSPILDRELDEMIRNCYAETVIVLEQTRAELAGFVRILFVHGRDRTSRARSFHVPGRKSPKPPPKDVAFPFQVFASALGNMKSLKYLTVKGRLLETAENQTEDPQLPRLLENPTEDSNSPFRSPDFVLPNLETLRYCDKEARK